MNTQNNIIDLNSFEEVVINSKKYLSLKKEFLINLNIKYLFIELNSNNSSFLFFGNIIYASSIKNIFNYINENLDFIKNKKTIHIENIDIYIQAIKEHLVLNKTNGYLASFKKVNKKNNFIIDYLNEDSRDLYFIKFKN